MKTIAFSFLLLFTTLTVVVSAYFLWQDADYEVAMSIEEEEEEGKVNESSIAFEVLFSANNVSFVLHSKEESMVLSNLDIDRSYETVYLNNVFSPPDVM